MRRPSVNVRAVADRYHGPNERIVEFSSDCGGGLIAFREHEGRLIVDVYRIDETVEVRRPAEMAVEHLLPGQRVRWQGLVEGQPASEAVVDDVVLTASGEYRVYVVGGQRDPLYFKRGDVLRLADR